jgi:hypothetical protein
MRVGGSIAGSEDPHRGAANSSQSMAALLPFAGKQA